LLIQVHSENHRSVCQTDAPRPKDAVSLGHLFTSLDLLTKAAYSDEGFLHPACISLNRFRNYTKIWKARMLAQQSIWISFHPLPGARFLHWELFASSGCFFEPLLLLWVVSSVVWGRWW